MNLTYQINCTTVAADRSPQTSQLEEEFRRLGPVSWTAEMRIHLKCSNWDNRINDGDVVALLLSLTCACNCYCGMRKIAKARECLALLLPTRLSTLGSKILLIKTGSKRLLRWSTPLKKNDEDTFESPYIIIQLQGYNYKVEVRVKR